MGHFFGLPHTFERDNGLELADGSNCETAGDGICDTPADPYEVDEPMSKWIDSLECRFIYKGKDANGDYYSPDLANYMSYYGSPCSCSRFTDGQYKAMVDNYNSGKIAW